MIQLDKNAYNYSSISSFFILMFYDIARYQSLVIVRFNSADIETHYTHWLNYFLACEYFAINLQ